MLDNRFPQTFRRRGRPWARLACALALITAAFLPASPAAAVNVPSPVKLTDTQRADIVRIQDYLNGLSTLEARFLQVTSTGQYSEGKLYLWRPGRLRIEYDPPVPILIIVRRGTLIYYDKQLKQTSYIDADKTPAGLLVRDHVSLLDSKDLMITRFENAADVLRVTLVRTDDPLGGNVTLVFSDHPLALKKWEVTDAQGVVTTVSLLSTQTGMELDPKLFEFLDPNMFKKPDDR